MDLYGLFLLDRKLREHAFRYLVNVETMVKTACAYRFGEAHRSPNACLDPGSYVPRNEYIMGERNNERPDRI